MERGTGVEPALTAWEAAVIPIYQPHAYLHIIAPGSIIFNSEMCLFLH